MSIDHDARGAQLPESHQVCPQNAWICKDFRTQVDRASHGDRDGRPSRSKGAGVELNRPCERISQGSSLAPPAFGAGWKGDPACRCWHVSRDHPHGLETSAARAHWRSVWRTVRRRCPGRRLCRRTGEVSGLVTLSRTRAPRSGSNRSEDEWSRSRPNVQNCTRESVRPQEQQDLWGSSHSAQREQWCEARPVRQVLPVGHGIDRAVPRPVARWPICVGLRFGRRGTTA